MNNYRHRLLDRNEKFVISCMEKLSRMANKKKTDIELQFT